MPATRKHYRNAIEEGARFQFEVMPVAVLGDAEDRVVGVQCVRTRMPSPRQEGRSGPPIVVPGSEFDVPADLVLVAYGFDRAPCPMDSDCAGLMHNATGEVVVDENRMTCIPGVFAGGDLVHEPGRLVETVRDARRAASAIDAYLSARAPKSAAPSRIP
jgi:glutamate synthase (NADPH/NADH) small chain